jgi:hypothetical protein
MLYEQTYLDVICKLQPRKQRALRSWNKEINCGCQDQGLKKLHVVTKFIPANVDNLVRIQLIMPRYT